MIYKPSQYDCDNMENGDIVYVRSVGLLYRFIRDKFMKDKPKIKVRLGWSEPVQYKECYQEDCTLIYGYELACVKKYENKVPCMLSRGLGKTPSNTFFLPLVQVTLYDIQIMLDKFHILTIPLGDIKRAIDDNQRTLKLFDDSRKIRDAIKFQKYKGEYFKDYALKNNIKEWTPVYCSVCGKPVVFNFDENDVIINNNCECKSLNFPLKSITYDEFALWYTNQIVTPSIIDRYNSFWFKRRDTIG